MSQVVYVQRVVRSTQFSRNTVQRPRSLVGETAVAVIRLGMWNTQSTGLSRYKWWYYPYEVRVIPTECF